MKQHRARRLASIAAVGIGVLVPLGSALADGRDGRDCNNRMLRGTYGIQMQGTRPAPPNGPMETLIGVVVRNYDGRGGVTQIDNIKGSISGFVPDRFGSGTYQVRDDCSVIVIFQPAPGVVIEERLVIVDGGAELRSITITPATLMVTSTSIKM